MNAAIQTIFDRLDELAGIPPPADYLVPELWLHPENPGQKRVIPVNPVEFYRGRLEAILAYTASPPPMLSSAGEWSKQAVVYNMFVRLTTAWDHDGDGTIRIEDLDGGYRETGTFLKAIALLPYIKHLGANTVHLLPVTAIGQDGNKGTLGSPYAIRNPYKLDERLAEPWLGLEVDLLFAAFVDAAHHLGMRVVTEFVFRTASKDSDWIPDHPAWFYWIDASVPDRDPARGQDGYGNPVFSKDELKLINLRVKRNDTSSLPPPGKSYRQMFTDPPESCELTDGRYIGTTAGGTTVRIPGAFADWPPDDVQPPWNDVTYLKLYDHPGFNYIAYNTIRIYDSRLTEIENENRGLWNTIINIIPHYQKNFGIDGVMIDMGHALPRRLKQSIVDRARKLNPDFAFWEENFAISAKSRQEGYNAAVGYLWTDEHVPAKLHEFCRMLATHDTPVPFFATPESHNTPRAARRPGGMVFSRLAMVVNSFLPAIVFLHQGYDLGESLPVNTGLGFTPEDIRELPSNTLPLFSHSKLCWDNDEEMSAHIAKVLSVRAAWEAVVIDPRHATFRLLPHENPGLLLYYRVSRDKKHAVMVAANLDCDKAVKTEIPVPVEQWQIIDALSGKTFQRNGDLFSIDFAPGEAFVFELTERPE